MRRSIDSWLDRFCSRHPGFGIPHLMNVIVAGNVIVYVLSMFNPYLVQMLAFSLPAILQGQIWRVLTFIFLPVNSSNPLFFLLTLYFYWFIGTTLEREWGSTKFTVFYLSGILLTLAAALALSLWGFSMANMYYVNMSMFFAFATLYPNMQVLFFFFLPVKVKWLAWLDAALFAIDIVRYLANGFWMFSLLPLVAVANYVIFFWSDLMELIARKAGQTRYRHSRQTVNFKQATRQAQQQKGYIHKCAVCGKTDTDYPDEEFRYCSKCNGYYCYCSEHIHNHVHIQ